MPLEFHENAETSNDEDPATEEPDAKARLGEIRVPALVITAGRDVRAINEAGEVIAAGIPGARRAQIAEADHMVPWRFPDELSRLILDFLA